MRTVSPSNSERNAFIDVAVKTMRQELDNPFVQQSLGNLATIYAEMIDSSFVPNIVDGVVLAPNDLGSDGLPIVAINRSETVTMEPYYHTQTRLQQEWARKATEQWAPRYDIEAILESWDEVDEENLPSVGLEDKTITKITASSRVVGPGSSAQLFERPPQGIGLVKKRPILMFGIDGPDSRFSPMIGHELEHVRQYVTRPIQFIKSQNHANMQALRGELESSNVASAFAFAMLQKGYVLPEEQTDEGLSVVHPISIDKIRKDYRLEHGLSGDPFEPSGGLLRELSRRGFGAMLHEAPNFEAIQQILNKRNEV